MMLDLRFALINISFLRKKGVGVATPLWPSVGGEAQHLEKLEVCSPSGFPNVQSSTARPKTPRIEVFLVSLKRS